MTPEELIKQIFRICQDTQCLDTNKNPNEEAQRLEDTVYKINDLCDNFIAVNKNHQKEPTP